MRYDCGPTWEEKVAAKKEWHRFFALLPRRVSSHDCRWLEYIERKGEQYEGLSAAGGFAHRVKKWRYEYRAEPRQ